MTGEVVTNQLNQNIERIHRLRNTAAILFGGAVVASCTSMSNPLVESPEATIREEVVFCFKENPDCTREDVARGDGLAVISRGSAIPLETIPEVCLDDGTKVEEVYDAEVTPSLIYAFMAVEDKRYCEHDGVDYYALARAVIQTLSGNTQGASTTEAMTGRMLYFDAKPEDDLERKLWEYYRAVPELNSRYTKTEILRKHFNIVYLGRNSFSLASASMAYFGVMPSDLDTAQSAALVALWQNPGRYEGSSDPEKEETARVDHENERNEVLDKMVEFGRLSPEKAAEYKALPLKRLPYNTNAVGSDFTGARSVYGEFVTQVIYNDLLQKLGSHDAVLQLKTVNTTISKEEMGIAARIYLEHSARLTDDGRQFGLVIVDQTGAITTYLPGLYDPNGPNPDLLQAHVVGGSQDKPFFVLSAMLAGATTDTMVGDPAYFEWLNYDGNGKNYKPTEAADRCPSEGDCTLRDSIAYSANWGILGLIKYLEEKGVPALENGYEIMRGFGIHCLQPVGPAGVVGGCELTPIQRALGSIQINGLNGRAIPPENMGRVYNSIVLDNGKTVSFYDATLPYQQIVPPEIAAMQSDIQISAVDYGTAGKLAEAAEKTIVFAKTGTPDGNTAPAVNLTWIDRDGNPRAAAIVLRQPNSLSSLGSDADGGNQPTELANDLVLALS